MVEKIETEMVNDFSEAYDKFSKQTPTPDNLLSFFIYLFEFVQTNSEMFKIFLGQDGDNNFIERLKVAIKQSGIPPYESASELAIYYYIPFAISGCVGVIKQWLDDGMNVAPKDMAIMISEMIK
jgi:hypothetical protein